MSDQRSDAERSLADALGKCVEAQERATTVEAKLAEAQNRALWLENISDGHHADKLKAEAEVERLRAALQQIVNRFDHADKIKRPVDGLGVAMAHDARTALGAAFPGDTKP